MESNKCHGCAGSIAALPSSSRPTSKLNDVAAKSGNRPRFKVVANLHDQLRAKSSIMCNSSSSSSSSNKSNQHCKRHQHTTSDPIPFKYPMTTRLGFLVLVYFSILHEQTSIISTISCDLLLIEQSTSSSANKWHENWHEQANRLGPQNGAQSVATAAAASSISRTKSEEPPPISLEDSSSSSSSSSGKIEKINKTTTMPPPPTCHGDELSASNLKHHQHQQHHHKRRHRLRRRRQARDISSRDAEPEQVIARPPVSWSSRDRNTTIKLAALATKLQQWLHCNRLNLLAQLELKQQVGGAESSTSPTSSTVSTTSSTATTTSTITTTTTTTESTDQEQHQHHHHVQSLSKIIDDGQAAGAAGAATSAAPVGSSTSSQNIELETGGTTAFCPAHFDGHLCWPKAKLGQQIQLPCPRINYYSNQITGAAAQSSPAAQAAPPTTVVAVAPLTSNEIQLQQAAAAAAPPATTNSQKQQLEEQLKPVLESIEKVQANKSATATQDDDASSLHQSIKQPVASGQVLELAAEDKTTTPPPVTTNDAINQQPATSKEFDLKLKLEQEEHKRWLSGHFENKYARRRCNQNGNTDMAAPIDQETTPQTIGQWQTNADYSECLAVQSHETSDRAVSSDNSNNKNNKIDENSDTDGRNLFDPADEWVKLDDPLDGSLFDSLTAQLERIEPNIDPYTEPDLLEQWQICISAIVSQQQQQQQPQQQQSFALPETANGSQSGNNSGRQCPIIFDGWRCWPATKAGETAYVSCPSNQPGFSAERMAHKICTLEADWYRHPMTNRYWSNYTTCVDTVDLAFRTKILNLYVIGNLISLIALTMSLIIFVSFKRIGLSRQITQALETPVLVMFFNLVNSSVNNNSDETDWTQSFMLRSLNCTRVTIHKNLFLSFITNNLMWIFWYTYVVNDADLLQSNPIGCRLWHILLHYFLVSNYFWMFCEGLYLHTLLVVAFVSEDKILKWFYLLGWLTPIPITLTYAYNRSFDEYHTNFCWMEESPYNIILMAPIGISLLLNLVFLINIVRVLVTKLRANNSPDTHQTRKAVRATLILIPLLGLHYMLTPFRPEAKSEWEVIYEIIAAVCTSFQGLCVALLFCFCNGEVMSAIRKKLKDSCFFRRQRDHKRAMRSRSNTAISNIFSQNNNYNCNNHNNNSNAIIKSNLMNSSTNNTNNTNNTNSTNNNNNNSDLHHHHDLNMNQNQNRQQQFEATSNFGQTVTSSSSLLLSQPQPPPQPPLLSVQSPSPAPLLTNGNLLKNMRNSSNNNNTTNNNSHCEQAHSLATWTPIVVTPINNDHDLAAANSDTPLIGLDGGETACGGGAAVEETSKLLPSAPVNSDTAPAAGATGSRAIAHHRADDPLCPANINSMSDSWAIKLL